MLDSILSGLKGQLTSTLTEKTGLDLGIAEKVLPVAQESVTEGVTSAIAGGNVSGILDMLKGAVGGGSTAGGNGLAGLAQNMVYKSIAGNFISKATAQLGLSESVAGSVSGLALPMIMDKIGGAAQAAGDTDEIDESSVMSAMGLDSGGLLDKAKGLLSGSGLGKIFG